MLRLPDQPVIDKLRLVGGCVRLRALVDASLLSQEVLSLPVECWGTTGGRVGVHRAAEAIFLRGHAPAEGELPIDERPALAQLPYVRELLMRIPAPPMRCLLAKLPPGATITPHIDRADYFSKTLRIHVPVITNDRVHMYCAGRSYHMRPGEVWVLNNSALHGVWNASADAARIHLICDFLPSAALLDLVAAGDRTLGLPDSTVECFLAAAAGSM